MRGLIEWFTRNHVAANLLMILLIAGGLVGVVVVQQESFPQVPPDRIIISVPYPAATPTEVEESICITVEEAVQEISGIEHIYSTADEGIGVVTIDLEDDVAISEVLDEVKVEIDAIDSFPDDAEEPIIEAQKNEERVMAVTVSGPLDDLAMKTLTEQLRDELLLSPNISKAEIVNAKAREVSIEIDEESLRRYQLTFTDVANAVRRFSLNLPAGSVKTDTGEVIFRSATQAYDHHEFGRIPVIMATDGSEVLIEDVAEVRVGLADVDQESRLDGDRALTIQVYRVGSENTPDVGDATQMFVDEAQASLPSGVSLTLWRNQSQVLHERLDLLKNNGIKGLMLVFIVLALFLRPRLAFWVSVGLGTAMLGTVWLMHPLGISLNLLTSFGFILVLGILVDDAIVVAENIDVHQRQGKKGIRASIDGAFEVMLPVSLAVITTGLAFSPMFQLHGRHGKFAGAIAIIVVLAIFLSLVESLFILPAHLSHTQKDEKPRFFLVRWLDKISSGFARGLNRVIDRYYRPLLERVLVWRYLVATVAVGLLIVTIGLALGGHVRFTFFPPIEGNEIIAAVTLPEGGSAKETEIVRRHLENTFAEVREEVEGNQRGTIVRHVHSSLGLQPGRNTRRPAEGAGVGRSRANLTEVHVELTSAQDRDVLASTLAQKWRDKIGVIPNALEVSVQSNLMDGGAPIHVEVSGRDPENLQLAANELKARLAEIPGTFNIADDYRPGKRELALEVKPSGTALGLSQRDLARQVRQGFYGEEAQRVLIDKEDTKVFVRYPEAHRESVGNLEQMRIRLPDRSEVAFGEVAAATETRGLSSIKRVDRQRTIVVTCDLDLAQANANEIIADLKAGFLPSLKSKYPTIRTNFAGEQSNQSKSLTGMLTGMGLAMFMMFALLGVVFRSYLQPLIILSAIPFGMAGAVWAHFFLGMDLTFMSMIGLLALMGVVVNDSLVMVEFINRNRREHGMDLLTALRTGAPRRFRPILLTSMTTFAGLLPILTEKSVQAAFLIPMAVTLAFGILFATFVILLIVPASYLIIEDVRRGLRRLGAVFSPPDASAEESPTPAPVANDAATLPTSAQ